MLPLCSRHSGCTCAGRLVLFDDVFDVMTGVHALCVSWAGSDHVLRRGATCWTWCVTFILDQMQLFFPSSFKILDPHSFNIY